MVATVKHLGLILGLMKHLGLILGLMKHLGLMNSLLPLLCFKIIGGLGALNVQYCYYLEMRHSTIK